MMKFLKSFHNLINIIKTKLVKDNNEVENIVNQDLQSDELQIKLALLIKDIDAVDQSDLKQVEYKKMNQETKNDPFRNSSCNDNRRDFNNFGKWSNARRGQMA